MLIDIPRDIINSTEKEGFNPFRLTSNFVGIYGYRLIESGAPRRTTLKITELAIRVFLDIISLPFRAIYAGIIQPGIEAVQTLRERIGYPPLNEEDDDFTLIDTDATSPQVPVQCNKPTPKPNSELTPPRPSTPSLSPANDPSNLPISVPPLTLPQPASIRKSTPINGNTTLNPQLALLLKSDKSFNRPNIDPKEMLHPSLINILAKKA